MLFGPYWGNVCLSLFGCCCFANLTNSFTRIASLWSLEVLYLPHYHKRVAEPTCNVAEPLDPKLSQCTNYQLTAWQRLYKLTLYREKIKIINN